jgi:hypothetical protein
MQKAEYKYSLDTSNQGGSNFNTMASIVKEWSKNELEQAQMEGYFGSIQRMIIEVDTDNCLNIKNITWNEFFSDYDSQTLHQSLLETGIVLCLVKRYAKIRVDWSKYVLIHDDGMKVPNHKDEFTYDEIEDIYKDGIFFVDLDKGKVDPFTLFDFSNPLWAALSIDDAATLLNADKSEIESNIEKGSYGLCRELAGNWIINLGKFASYHNLD